MTVVRRTVALLACACIGVPLACTTAAGAATARPAPGYWLAGADGGVFSFGAPFYGSGVGAPGACAFNLPPPSNLLETMGCADIASTPSGNGYWLVNSFRSATAFGQAGQALQAGCTSSNGAAGYWTGIASSPTGSGFFVASSNGTVSGCGDAVPLGGIVVPVGAPAVVGIAATPDGKGYWLAAADGGVFSFGSAPFEGSMGGRPMNAAVVGIAAYP